MIRIDFVHVVSFVVGTVNPVFLLASEFIYIPRSRFYFGPCVCLLLVFVLLVVGIGVVVINVLVLWCVVRLGEKIVPFLMGFDGECFVGSGDHDEFPFDELVRERS